jgi:plasmid stabilization system protein ParE
MLVRWTQPAVDDLFHICDYTADHFGAAQARRVADAIYETATSLEEMPNRGRKGRKPGTREMLLHRGREQKRIRLGAETGRLLIFIEELLKLVMGGKLFFF